MEESSISGPRVIVVISVAAIALLNFRWTIVLSDLTSHVHVSRATTRAEVRGGPCGVWTEPGRLASRLTPDA